MGRGTSSGIGRGSHGPEPHVPDTGRLRRTGIGRGSSGGVRTTEGEPPAIKVTDRMIIGGGRGPRLRAIRRDLKSALSGMVSVNPQLQRWLVERRAEGHRYVTYDSVGAIIPTSKKNNLPYATFRIDTVLSKAGKGMPKK